MMVRAACARDLPRLVAIAPDGHAPLVERAFVAAAAGRNRILVAELKGELVGQVWLDIGRRRDERVAIIWALRVTPAHQAQRVGAALLIAAERLAVRLGFVRVEVGVSGGIPSLCAMYERRGYHPAGSRVDCERWRSPTGESQSALFDQSLWEKELVP
jgi:GNAT superfamily N-acetyltransferase